MKLTDTNRRELFGLLLDLANVHPTMSARAEHYQRESYRRTFQARRKVREFGAKLNRQRHARPALSAHRLEIVKALSQLENRKAYL